MPPRETALSGPENSHILGLPFDLADGRQKPRSGSSDGKKSGSYVIPGLAAMGCHLYAHASTPLPGQKLPANPRPDVGSKSTVFWGAA